MKTVAVECEVTGNVWKVERAVGDRVEEEDVLVIVESMKMEIPVEAPCNGTLVSLHVNEGDSVKEDQIIASIEPD